MKLRLLLIALVLALNGCVNFGSNGDSPAVVYYVLDDGGSAATPGPAADGQGAAPAAGADDSAHVPTLLVRNTTAGGFYDSDQLVFSRSPGTRGQYQFARWAERPGGRFAELLRTRLDRLGRYRIAPPGGIVRGDLLLDTRLVEFYHDAVQPPGKVRLVVRAELVDLRQHRLVGRRVFEQQVPVTTYDAAGAARASNEAVGRLLDDLGGWLATLK
ncbi:MAG: ABC-type transport auxiliary lipoprotein family protein [Betaproteobacteria bacterium]|nr:ABC-type transport auxiliary lipoprotein family protein [Betaproteobacteria bacterium]